MGYKLLFKNPEGSQHKWSTMGNMKTNKHGNLSIGLMTARLKEAILAAEREGKTWVNISVVEDKLSEAQEKHTQAKANAYQPEDFDDQIPF